MLRRPALFAGLFLCPLLAQEPPLTSREKLLLERIELLERRVAGLEARAGLAPAPAPPPPAAPAPQPAPPPPVPPVSFLVDGYYAWNFNRPAGRVNLLRAYDVLSNSFSIAQAAAVFDIRPQPEAGRRFGLRVDLQFGQAAEAAGGSPANELRPQVWRNLFQAYGTWVAPLGRGLTLDFGKWASPMGIEGNYAKDQMNYSRSYSFAFLPLYHTGLRASYAFSDRFIAGYWLVNGIGQAEDFNDDKSQTATFTWKPIPALSWTTNYHTGVESPDLRALPLPSGPPDIIRPAPEGRTHIFDTYAAWDLTRRTTVAAEADYAIHRLHVSSAPAHVVIGALYARRRLSEKFALAARAEYLSDRGGWFSGITQSLKETTLTLDQRLAEGFLLRWEWRRDFSNRPFFYTAIPGVLKKEQNTATVGLIWWWGKEGAW